MFPVRSQGLGATGELRHRPLGGRCSPRRHCHSPWRRQGAPSWRSRSGSSGRFAATPQIPVAQSSSLCASATGLERLAGLGVAGEGRGAIEDRLAAGVAAAVAVAGEVARASLGAPSQAGAGSIAGRERQRALAAQTATRAAGVGVGASAGAVAGGRSADSVAARAGFGAAVAAAVDAAHS